MNCLPGLKCENQYKGKFDACYSCFLFCFFPKQADYFLSSSTSCDILVLFTVHGDKQDGVKQKAFVEPYFKDKER